MTSLLSISNFKSLFKRTLILLVLQQSFQFHTLLSSAEIVKVIGLDSPLGTINVPDAESDKKKSKKDSESESEASKSTTAADSTSSTELLSTSESDNSNINNVKTSESKESESKNEKSSDSSSNSNTNSNSDSDSNSFIPPTGFSAIVRWFWPLIIMYMFFAQTAVCDEWFVPSISVIAKRFNIPEDVAGATLMALGCNGPELFTNASALFITHSDLGFGTVVGSEIFNLLLIIGGSVLATPKIYELTKQDNGNGGLQLTVLPFLRDMIWYLISIILLIIVLWDNIVTLFEATFLLGCAVLFGLTVGGTKKFTEIFPEKVREIKEYFGVPEGVGEYNDDKPEGYTDLPGTGTSNDLPESVLEYENVRLSSSVSDSNSNTVSDNISNNSTSFTLRLDLDPEHGNSNKLEILENNNNNNDNNINPDSSGNLSPYVSTPATAASQTDLGVPLLASSSGKNRGSPLNSTVSHVTVIKTVNILSEVAEILTSRSSTTAVSGPGGNTIDTTEVILKDSNKTVITIPAPITEKQRRIHISLLDALARSRSSALIENEFKIAEYKPEVQTESQDYLAHLLYQVGIPVNYLLESTMSWCDPKQKDKEKHFVFAFSISMAWLAIFSFILCESADFVNADFGISQQILGVTLCAAGTSFPNLWASLLTAKEGKSAMAVANALGSNIQNVFLALALPWFFKTLFADNQQIPMATPGMLDSLMWMAGTWVILAVLSVQGRMRLGAYKVGYLFFGLYGVFLYDAIFITGGE